MQGRLVASATGDLESSPGPRWREEFSIAATLELNHIELVADRVLDSSNPIWSADGRREIVFASKSAGVGLTSLCINETLATGFEDPELALDLATRLEPVVSDLHIAIVVVPMLEASDLSKLDWSRAALSVRLLADHLSGRGARIALELGVSGSESLRFLDATASPGVGLCYDVGNATALGFDAASELRRLGRSVWHLHAKDKNAAGQNVRFGTGKVEFAPVFAALAQHGFDGVVTMEATRGDDPIVTAAEHRAFLCSMAEDVA